MYVVQDGHNKLLRNWIGYFKLSGYISIFYTSETELAMKIRDGPIRYIFSVLAKDFLVILHVTYTYLNG